MTSSLEITEKEYLIKLNKQQFDISFIRNLLKMVEISNPNTPAYCPETPNSDSSFGFRDGYFSHLDEK